MILEWVDANHKPFDELALAHWNNPELAYKEYEAVRLQMDFLKRRGFSVTQKEGMSTAFMAEWGSGGPVIGILASTTRWGGLSQNISAAKESVCEGAPGHGGGHNLLGVYSMLAACAVKEALSAEGKSGRVRYYGCPTEEQLTGKAEMAKLGYFDGKDISITWHLWDVSTVTGSTMTALFSAKFHFAGGWTQRPRRGGADERRGQLPPGTHGGSDQAALCHHQRRLGA